MALGALASAILVAVGSAAAPAQTHKSDSSKAGQVARGEGRPATSTAAEREAREQLSAAGMRFSGLSPDGSLVEIVEIESHPWFLACQFHPEFQSKPVQPHPIFRDFVEASLVAGGYREVKQALRV